jgi:integrase
MNTRALHQYLKNGLPENGNSKAIYKNRINMCINWGLANGYKTDHSKYTKKEQTATPRTRTFNMAEINRICNDIRPIYFRYFIQFAYYTGMRRGELCALNKYDIYKDHLVCVGKTGTRLVKLNRQAQNILMNIRKIWEYKGSYVTQKFKKELRRLDIPNGRFHDLRRTFGFNLIVNGMPIYKVSKLLGHTSVTTTEKHYAPLLATQIEDFTL